MNRETILTSIQRHLRESLAETGEVRPLGEIVARVATELRAQPWQGEPVGVLPVTLVSAFVDDAVSAEEADTVCTAVLNDNSVLAELIAAVRASQPTQADLQPLSDGLAQRLSDLVSSTQQQQRQPSPAGIDTVAQGDDDSVEDVPATKIGEDQAGKETVDDLADRAVGEDTLPEIPLLNVPPPTSSRGSESIIGTIVFLGTLAAAITMAIIAFRRHDQSPRPEDLAENENDHELIDPNPGVPPNPTPMPEDPPSDPSPQIVQQSPKPDQPVRPIPAPGPDPQRSPPVPTPPDNVAQQGPPPVRPNTPENPVPQVPQPTMFRDLRWEINGLVAQRNPLPEDPDYRQNVTWSSVADGSKALEASTPPKGMIAVKTLPFSRAEATFGSGGRVVMDADTTLKLSLDVPGLSARMQLDHGSIAMMNIPAGTSILLRGMSGPITNMQWETDASAVLQYATDGLQVHVKTGTIKVGKQTREGESVSINPEGDIKPIKKMERMPRFVNTKPRTLPRNIIAQFESSDNLRGSLRQSLNRDHDPGVLISLSTMHASLSGPSVIGLASNDDFAIRVGALYRLLGTPEWDPRAKALWTAAARGPTQQRINKLRRLFQLKRSGGKPSVQQLEQLLDGLEAQDVFGRALADFLLRKFYGDRAPYDPTWTAPNRARAVNEWRKAVGRPVQNRPAGAAALRTQNGA